MVVNTQFLGKENGNGWNLNKCVVWITSGFNRKWSFNESNQFVGRPVQGPILYMRLLRAERSQSTLGGSGWSISRLAKAAGASAIWPDARRCGAKHISNSKCTKHTILRPLLEVEMSKKCRPLWREAHFQVKMYKTPHVGTTVDGWDVVLWGGGLWTLPKVSKAWRFCSSYKNDGRHGTFQEKLFGFLAWTLMLVHLRVCRDFRRLLGTCLFWRCTFNDYVGSARKQCGKQLGMDRWMGGWIDM